MPTLDVRGVSLGNNITVNYSSLLPMTAATNKRLVEAVQAARSTIYYVNCYIYRHIFQIASDGGLKSWAQSSKEKIPTADDNPFSGNSWYFDDLIEIMKVHLSLHRAPVEDWVTSIARTSRLFRLIETGLNSPITISDARSSIIEAFYDESDEFRAFAQFTLGIQQLRDKRPWKDSGLADAIAALTKTGPGISHSLDQELKQWRNELHTRLQNLSLFNLHITKEDAKELGRELGYVNFSPYVRKGKERTENSTAQDRWNIKEIAADTFKFISEDEHMNPQFRRSIHINFEVLENPKITPGFVAHCILHEASHKFAGTEDFAYSDESHYTSIGPAQAANNADSIAMTASCMRRKNLFMKAMDL